MKKNIASIGTFIIALTSLAVSGVSAYLFSEIALIWQVSLGVSLLAFFSYVFMERAFFSEVFSKKTTRYGLNSLIMSVVAVAIAVVVNMIIVNHDIKKDFTKNKIHTLSDQSIKVLKGLKGEIRLKAFINPTQMAEFENIFEKYTYYSKLLKKEYVDVDKDPFIVQKYNIKQAGTIVFESDTRTARVENLMGSEDPKLEEKITNAIIQVEKGDKKKVYYLSGHGEKLISDTGRDGYSEMKEQLENGRYKVEELVLAEKGEVPSDSDLLIIAAPKSDFLDPEMKALEAYLQKGGKTLFMLEPISTPMLKGLLAKYGAVYNTKKTVVELNPLQQLAGGNPLTPIVTTYDQGHEITREAKQLTLFPIATPIEKTEKAPGELKVTTLLSTSPKSFESDLKDSQVKPNPKTDRKGPLSLALAISGKLAADKPASEKPAEKSDLAKPATDEKKENEFRMIVIGDSDFASNSGRRFGINADLFQNMLSWLSHEEDLISIHPKPADTSEFEITEERSRVINLASIVFLPLIMMLSGIGVWASRRRK